MTRPPTATEVAQRWAEQAWTELIRVALVSAEPASSDTKKRRGAAKRAWTRFDTCRRSVLSSLRAGSLSAETARRTIADTGLTDSVFVATCRSELSDAIAKVLRDGNNVWGEELECGVLHIWFYNDPSHWSDRLYG